MKKFTSFLREMTEADEKKLKHLEHLEDHPINAGKEGVDHAMNNLLDVHRKLRGRENDTKITMKYDGSPSVVFGHHPQTGKFFVASKSVFNKNPKLNYTDEDIEKNHGHAPGLVEKLKHALKHLPKVVPPRGVYQGDIMHTAGDVQEVSAIPAGDGLHETVRIRINPALGVVPKKFARVRLVNQ